jgi:hypothetical protein
VAVNPQRNNLNAPREEELLLAVARPKPGPDDMERLKEMLSAQPPLNWARIMKLAEIHRIRPQLYTALSGDLRPLVPAEVFESLRVFYLSNINRNMMLTQETLRISQVLDNGYFTDPNHCHRTYALG